MKVQTTLCIERDDEEIELHIFGDAEPYVPGCRRGHPDNWTPDEGGHASIIDIALDEDCNKLWDGELTKNEKQEAESLLLSALEEEISIAKEDAAVDRAESMRDDEAYIYDHDYGDYGPDIYDF